MKKENKKDIHKAVDISLKATKKSSYVEFRNGKMFINAKSIHFENKGSIGNAHQ